MNALDLVAPVAEDVLATADEVEASRRLPEPLMRKLTEAGLFSIYTPREFGGLELSLPDALRVVEEVSRLDGSTGWTVALGFLSGFFTPSLPERSAARLFVNGSALIAGAPGFRVQAHPVEGGYRLSGQWSFCSGAPNATWVNVAAPVFDGEAPRMGPMGPEMITAFMHPSDVQIVEGTWDVTGMQGTGSYDLRVEDLFVPSEMVGMFALPAGPVALRERPLNRIPFMTALAVAQSPTVCLGIARHAIDEFRELALRKESPMGPKLIEQAHAQTGLARMEALVRSARVYWYDTVGELWDTVTSGRDVSMEQRVSVRLAALTAAENSVATVDMAYRLAGSTSVFRSSLIDRCWRDVHAAAQHAQVQEGRWETAGRVLFGLEPASLIV
jgi:alkylation response protein AidB-like acyl-CoA dehydrogenase